MSHTSCHQEQYEAIPLESREVTHWVWWQPGCFVYLLFVNKARNQSTLSPVTKFIGPCTKSLQFVVVSVHQGKDFKSMNAGIDSKALLEIVCSQTDLTMEELLNLSLQDFRQISKIILGNGPVQHAALFSAWRKIQDAPQGRQQATATIERQQSVLSPDAVGSAASFTPRSISSANNDDRAEGNRRKRRPTNFYIPNDSMVSSTGRAIKPDLNVRQNLKERGRKQGRADNDTNHDHDKDDSDGDNNDEYTPYKAGNKAKKRKHQEYSGGGLLKDAGIQRSLGRTRQQLNLYQKKIGLTSPFGQGVMSKNGLNVSHITLSDKWNLCPKDYNEPLQWWVGEGPNRLSLASPLNPKNKQQKGIPVFFACKEKNTAALCHYIGHWKCVKFQKLNQTQNFKNKVRQALLEFEFVEFNESTANIIKKIE